MSESKQFCTFYVDGLFFGVDVLTVQEVLTEQDMTPVPLASQEVCGLINLRGQIVTAIDLRRRLVLGIREDEQTPMNIVVNTEDGIFSLLVDEIGDVIEPEEESYEKPPETLEGTAKDLVTGVYKLEGQLLLILDTKKAVILDNSRRGITDTSVLAQPKKKMMLS
ncbi:MAG: purine-binding chemotaxis protein CheW [Candidatus Pelagisphaera sp.]|jgi:purine-binding chemotaxis protein CheW